MMRLPAPAEPEPCTKKEIQKLVGFVSKTQLKLLILDSMALGRPPMKSEIRLAEEDGKGTGIPTEDLGNRPTFPESEARLNRLPLKYLRDIIVDACVAGKPPTEAGIEAALRRHIAEQQAQTTCCGRCCGCTCGWA